MITAKALSESPVSGVTFAHAQPQIADFRQNSGGGDFSARKQTCNVRLTTSRLAAAALVFMLLPALAFANTQGDVTSFPFLSLDVSQLADIKGAFLVQWLLFNFHGSSSSNAALNNSALYFLALAATMMGALAIIFNPSSHNLKTYGSWLLLVIICLFAPYQSKLLFYPTVRASDPIAVGSEPDKGCSKDGQYVACGFMPQLVAAHVATTLQLVFYDVFRSASFTGLVDGVVSGLQLSHTPVLDVGGGWLGDAHQFMSTCQGKSILPTSLATNASVSKGQTTQSSAQPYSIASAMERIKGYYQQISQNGLNADFSTPPPAIILDPNNTNAVYLQEIGKLCQAILGDTASANTACGNTSKLPPDQAIYTDNTAVKSLLAKAAAANGNADPSSIYFYLRGPAATDAADTARGEAANCHGSLYDTCADQWNKAQWALGKPIAVNPETTPFENPQLTPSLLNTISKLTTAPVTVQEYTNPTTSTPTTAPCSAARANALFNGMFDNGYMSRALGANGFSNLDPKMQNFTKLRNLIANPSSALPSTFTVQDISSCPSGVEGDAAAVCQIAQNLVNVINTQPMQGKLASAAGNPTLQRKLLASFIEEMVASSTADKSQSATSQAGAFNATMLPQVVGDVSNMPASFLGSTTLGTAVGKIFAGFGNALVSLGANFIGPMSVAVLHFTKIIVDMSLVAIIIITPVAFLIGLAIPGHANGLLIQSVLFVFVLKMVPVTFLIVDNIAALIFKAFGAIGNDGIKQDIFVFAMAGMYTNIVGLTMLLLFKLGDVNNIQKLTEIDGAANKIAEAGKDLTIAVASFIGLGAARAATGGIASALGRRPPAKGGPNTLGGGEPPSGPSGSGEFASLPGLGLKGPVVEGMLDDQPDGQSLADDALRRTMLGDQFTERATALEPGWDNGLPSRMPNPAEPGPTAEEQAARLQMAGTGHWPAHWEEGMLAEAGRGADASKYMRGIDERNAGLDASGNTLQPTTSPAGMGNYGVLPATGSPIRPMQQGGQGPVSPAQAFNAQQPTGQAPSGTAQPGFMPTGQQPASSNTGTPSSAPQAPGPRPAKDIETYYQQILEDSRDGLNLQIPSHLTNALAKRLAAAAEKPATDQLKRLQRVEAKGELNYREADISGVKGFLRSLGSGMVGGLMAGGGLNKIPVVGELIGIAMNEYYEGPERARTWSQNEDGMRGWLRARGNAARGEAAKKMRQPYGGQAEYLEWANTGTFNVSVHNAQLHAARAVAKAFDEHKGRMLVEDKAGRTLGARDFAGGNSLIQAIESLDKDIKAAQFYGGGGKIDVGHAAAPQNVTLTNRVLADLVTARGYKEIDSNLSAILSDHMYINTKAGTPGFNGMTRYKGEDLRRFVHEEMSTGYQSAAYAKMVSGKQEFRQSQGVAAAIQDAIATEAAMMADFRKANPAATKAQINAYKDTLPISRINKAAFLSGFSNGTMRSYRAKDPTHITEDLKAQIKNLDNAQKYAANFEPSVSRILRDLSGRGMNQNVIIRLQAQLQDFGDEGRHNKAMFGKPARTEQAGLILKQLLVANGFSDKAAEDALRDIGFPL